VRIDEPGADDASGCRNRALRDDAVEITDLDDPAAVDGKVAPKRRLPASVDDQAVPDQQIENRALLAGCRRIAGGVGVSRHLRASRG
jgi:hypothetical protein